MKKSNEGMKRLCAIVLSAAIAIAFVPAIGGQHAFAGQKNPAGADLTITEADIEAAGSVNAAVAKASGLDETDVNISIPDEEVPDVPEMEQAGDLSIQGDPIDGDSDVSEDEQASEVTGSIKVVLDKKTGKATVTGTVSGDTFYGLYVDGSYDRGLYGATSFTETVDMTYYDVGYHRISAVTDDQEKEFISDPVPTYIYEKPACSLNSFSAGKNYFTYKADGANTLCDTYLDIKKSGGKWQTGFGPIGYNDSKKKSGLKAGTKYQVRAYYGKKFTFEGKTYLFTGKDVGKVSKVRTIKTGVSSKPAVKSIKVSNVKVSYYYLTIWFGYYGKRYKIYNTTFKVTVTLKKKPGAYGIYIGSKRLKGNKKKYTTTMTVSGNQKGKKVKFGVYSYQHAAYGGYSPTRYKTVRIK